MNSPPQAVAPAGALYAIVFIVTARENTSTPSKKTEPIVCYDNTNLIVAFSFYPLSLIPPFCHIWPNNLHPMHSHAERLLSPLMVDPQQQGLFSFPN